MDTLARDFADQGFGSIFIYTHEAHPGQLYPHHTSHNQKMAHARVFREEFQVERPILVDALDGACHRAFGSMPNMTWILDRAARPVYKADWTEAPNVRSAIEGMLNAARLRKESRMPVRPYTVEKIEYREQDREKFLQGLERGGDPARAEYLNWIKQMQHG